MMATTSGDALAEMSIAVTTPSGGAPNKEATQASSSRVVVSVGSKLPGFLSMCIYRFLASIFSKSPFQLKRKKSQGLGSRGAICKNGHPYIFLNELCKSHNLQKSGSKQNVMERLLNNFFIPNVSLIM
jgi:hypothetical protein